MLVIGNIYITLRFKFDQVDSRKYNLKKKIVIDDNIKLHDIHFLVENPILNLQALCASNLPTNEVQLIIHQRICA